jgi:hypothetical protein
MTDTNSFFDSFKWWSIEAQELQEQENKYSELKITESYRGRAFLVVLTLCLISIVYGLVLIVPSAYITGLLVASLSIFIYKGFRWAMLLVMIIWTIEKAIAFLSSPWLSISLWVLVMGPLFKAWKLEGIRRQKTATLQVKKTRPVLLILAFVVIAILSAAIGMFIFAVYVNNEQFAKTGRALDGSTSLHHAAFYGEPEKLQALLDSGADINAGNKFGETPLHRAVMSENIKVMTILLDNGADINAVKITGMTPLNKAIFFGKTNAAVFLIQHGADITIEDNEGNSPLDTARNTGNTALIEILSR